MSVKAAFRWGIGTLISAAAVAAVIVAPPLAAPLVETATPSTEHAVRIGGADLVCDTRVLALGRNPEAPSAIEVAADTQLTADVVGGGDVGRAELAYVEIDATTEMLEVAEMPEVAAGATSASVRTGDIAGFTASACTAPAMESWLVGGTVTLGTTSLVSIANPTDVTAVVSLTAYGVAGAEVPVGYDALAIPAGSIAVIPLASLSGTAGEAPALRVSAENVPVRASLQTSAVETLDAAGLDVQTATLPSARVTIPGVLQPEVQGEIAGEDRAALRLVSESATTAEVTIQRVDGSNESGDPEVVELDAGVPLTVDLGDLAAGEYTVDVVAEDAVAAAVRTTTGAGGGSDFAWFVGAEAVGNPVAAAVPQGRGAQLFVTNRDEDAATVTIRLPDGADEQIAVASGETRALPLGASGVLSIDPAGYEIAAAISYADGSELASVAITGDSLREQTLTVYPRG